MAISFQIPITYSMIYGVQGKSPLDYLTGLNRSTIIKSALFLLHNEEKWKNFRTFCEMFFSEGNNELANELWKKYLVLAYPKNENDSFFPPTYSILSKHSCLELLRIGFSLPINKEDVSDNQYLEISIFQALLSINETQSDLCFDKIDKIPEPLKEAYSMLITVLPYNEFTNINTSAKFLASCVKSEMLFTFCEQNDKYKIILDQFLKKHECANWETYIYTVAKIFIMNNGDKDNYTAIVLDPDSESYSRDLSTLLGLSIDITKTIAVEDNVDYKYFRNYPLVRVSENEFILIYSSLCAERFYNSLIFNFNEINKGLAKKDRITDIFQDYTSKFSEEYMFYKVMERIISKQKYLSMSGEECRYICNHNEPDYYIRNWDEVFLFEFKDVLMDADTKTSKDCDKLKELIERKLVYNKENQSKKGIEQLTENINRILSGTFVWDKKIIPNQVKIYPILVVGDTKFVSPGMSFILNDYFLKSLEAKGIGRKQVRDLIVIDINTLILYQNEFADKRMTIKKTCDNYYNYLKTKRPLPNNPDNIYENAFHYLYSISTFIEKNYKIKSNRFILSLKSATYRV